MSEAPRAKSVAAAAHQALRISRPGVCLRSARTPNERPHRLDQLHDLPLRLYVRFNVALGRAQSGMTAGEAPMPSIWEGGSRLE